MQGKSTVTSFTAAVLALTCALVLGAVVFSQSRAFRDSFERMAERDIRLLAEITILDAIQTEAKDVTDRIVDVMLVALRRKLGAWAPHIETVRGIGYRLG